VRAANGTAVGWMRAQIGRYSHVTRVYDAVFPPAVGDGLAAAATVALDAEIGWIEDHATNPGGSEEEQRGDHDADRHAGSEDADGHLADAIQAAPHGPVCRGALRHALHPVPVERLDVLLAGRRERLDALLGVRRDRRDALLGDLGRGERGQRHLQKKHEYGGREPHRPGA
jgi:hypothetical protein